MTKSNVHLIADETLGGIQREFIEVERKADFGDYVINRGNICKVKSESNDGIFYFVDFDGAYSGIDAWYISESITLEPTDIVQIDSTRYRIVERIAKVGEKVLHFYKGKSEGPIQTVTNVTNTAAEFNEYYDSSTYDTMTGYTHGNYFVLVPVESEEPLVTVDATQCSEAVLDMLANLARRVTELEEQIEKQGERNVLQGKENMAVYERLQEIGHNVETFAQEHTTLQQVVKSVKERGITTAEQTESNTQDIADLDDRTQTLVEPKQAAEALLRKIAKLIEEEGVGI